jgi:HPt (histidine-containing phosphotransfer) domain-containing protein
MRPEDRGNGGAGARPVFARRDLLERLGGDEQLLAQVLEVFLSDAPLQLEALLRAVADADLAAVQRRAHGLKGAAANVGAMALRGAALELEVAADAGDHERIQRLTARIEQELTTFCELTKD